jgi:type IV secretory pathway TrbL component
MQQLRAQLKTTTASPAPQQWHAGAGGSVSSAAEDFFSVGGGGGAEFGATGQTAVKPKLGQAAQDKAAGAPGAAPVSDECTCS